MPTRMKHEEHGWTHAYTPEEVAAMEKIGWVVEVPPEPKKPDEPKRKPGRPPKAK